jgi:hypothetical protein
MNPPYRAEGRCSSVYPRYAASTFACQARHEHGANEINRAQSSTETAT